MIKVAHFIESYLFATGSWLYSQLRANLYESIVLTRRTENLDIFPFPSIYYCRDPFSPATIRGQTRFNEMFEKLTRRRHRYFKVVIQQENVNVLHAHGGTEGYNNIALKRETGLPFVTSFYGIDLSIQKRIRKWDKRYQQLFKEGDRFLVEGPHMASVLEQLGCPREKIIVKPLGVPLNQIPSHVRELPADNQIIQCLLVGTFREKKGIPYGVEAFHEACLSIPNMRLTIVGGAHSFNERVLLESVKQNICNIQDKVEIKGHIRYPEYLKLLTNYHVGLVPSVTASDGDTEGGAPVAAIEMAAGGLPIIGTNHCDIPQVVLDGESGYLVPERDSHALAQRLVQLVSSPERYASMSHAAIEHIHNHYDIQKIEKHQQEIYESVIPGRGMLQG